MPLYATDKPLGLTSFDVVARARRILQTRKIGHTGTLDPLATGVLVLCVNDSTKLVQFLTPDRKDYLAVIALGAGTPTLDAEGPVLETADVGTLEPERIARALEGLAGEQRQIPPQYSAIQVGGQRAYDVARAGGALELPARPVTMALELLGVFSGMDEARGLRFAPLEAGWGVAENGRAFDFPPTQGAFPVALVRARVSSGTYLRAMARDLGLALGLPAHLAGLVRTRVGRFRLEDCAPLEDLAKATPLGELEALDLPRLEVDAATARALRDGKKPEAALEGRFVVVQGGELVAIVDALEGRLRVVRAWAGG